MRSARRDGGVRHSLSRSAHHEQGGEPGSPAYGCKADCAVECGRAASSAPRAPVRHDVELTCAKVNEPRDDGRKAI